MADVGPVTKALMSTQALEKVQEAARRLGETQQQAFAATLNRQIDEKEHRVEHGEDLVREDLDPNARRRQEDERQRRSQSAQADAATCRERMKSGDGMWMREPRQALLRGLGGAE